MFGNGKIFISHSHEDNYLCDTLTAALDAWQVEYWFDLAQLTAGQELLTYIQPALSARDIFMRVCSPAAQRSPWMDQEETLARNLRAPNRTGKRLMIDLILVPGYQITPAEQNDLIIDATKVPTEAWILQLRKALGVAPRGKNMNRRAFVGVGVTSLAALGALGYAGKVLLTPPPLSRDLPQVYATPAASQASHARVLWHYTFGTSLLDGHGYGITVNGGTIYGCNTRGMFALATKDGTLLWNNDTVYIPSQVAPIVVGAAACILATPQNADLSTSVEALALNTQDGSVEWRTVLQRDNNSELNHYTATLGGAGNDLVAQYNDTLVALDVATGKPRWAPMPQDFNQDAVSANTLIATPTVANNVIYAGMVNGNLSAYDLAAGKLLWSVTHFATPNAAPIQSMPAVVNGIVYVGRNDGYCYAIDTKTQKIVWQQQLLKSDNAVNDFFVGAPTVVDGVVYIGGGLSSGSQQAQPKADVVCALDAQTGRVLWQVNPSQTVADGIASSSILSQPLVVGDRVYVTGLLAPVNSIKRDVVYALDRNGGSVQWYHFVASSVNAGAALSPWFPSAPVAQDNVLYFASTDSTIYALSLA